MTAYWKSNLKGVALAALLRNKLGRLSFSELGEKLVLRRSEDLSVSYMGFALRTLLA